MTRALAATLFAGLLLVPAAGTHGIEEGGTFRVGLPGWNSIDPLITGGISVIARPTCGSLMMFPDKPLPEGLGVVPEIATNYPKVTNGGTTYTFTIRKGVRFSTGSPVTAQSFAHTINRLLNPTMKSAQATNYDAIVGAQKVIEGKAETASGVIARGDTLIIRLKKPVGDFATRTAALCVVPEATPIDPEGVKAPAPGRRPLLPRAVRSRTTRSTGAEPLLSRRSTTPRRPFRRGHDRRLGDGARSRRPRGARLGWVGKPVI